MTATANTSVRRAPRRLLVWLALTASVGLLAGASLLGWRHWFRAPQPPQPPTIDLTSAEPLVAHVIEKALAGVREKPYSAEAWGHLGLVLRAHAYDRESNVCFAYAETFDPKDPRWPYLQGLPLRFSDPDAAQPCIERAVVRCDRFAPDKTAPRLLLAEMLLDKGGAAEAETHLRKVLEREPDNVRAHYDLGMAAFARDDLRECLRYLSPLTDNPAARKKVASQLAVVYLRQGDAVKAAEFARQTRDLPADWPWKDPYVAEYEELDVGRLGRLNRVDDMEKAGAGLAERLQLLRQLVEESPADPNSRLALGKAFIKAGDTRSAERAFREAARQTPEKPEAHFLLGMVLLLQADDLHDHGDADSARRTYREAAESAARTTALKPEHALAHLLRGMALRRLGEPGEALAEFRAAVVCRPELAQAHQLLGETLADNGRDLEALAELQMAVELGGKEPQIQARARARYAQVLMRAFQPLFP